MANGADAVRNVGDLAQPVIFQASVGESAAGNPATGAGLLYRVPSLPIVLSGSEQILGGGIVPIALLASMVALFAYFRILHPVAPELTLTVLLAIYVAATLSSARRIRIFCDLRCNIVSSTRPPRAYRADDDCLQYCNSDIQCRFIAERDRLDIFATVPCRRCGGFAVGHLLFNSHIASSVHDRYGNIFSRVWPLHVTAAAGGDRQ